MPDALLDYSSWSFQLIAVLLVLYLVVGLIRPSMVLARSRRTVAIVSVAGLLAAMTVFYLAVRQLPGADVPASAVESAPQQP
jgi:formate hydrogenlyase subunit 4